MDQKTDERNNIDHKTKEQNFRRNSSDLLHFQKANKSKLGNNSKVNKSDWTVFYKLRLTPFWLSDQKKEIIGQNVTDMPFKRYR